jgi:hypothetical protein
VQAFHGLNLICAFKSMIAALEKVLGATLCPQGHEFFHNAGTNQSMYEHPMDEHYRQVGVGGGGGCQQEAVMSRGRQAHTEGAMLISGCGTHWCQPLCPEHAVPHTLCAPQYYVKKREEKLKGNMTQIKV